LTAENGANLNNQSKALIFFKKVVAVVIGHPK